MTNATASGHRGATAAILTAGGGAPAAATWVGGAPGLAIGLVAFYAGAVVSAALHHGDVGAYGLVCFVGGATYAGSLFVLKRRG